MFPFKAPDDGFMEVNDWRIQMYSQSEGPWATLTINNSDAKPKKGIFLVKDYNENTGVYDWLKEQGFVLETLNSSPCGEGSMILCKLDVEKIKEWGKDAPEKEQEDQEKLYHLVYQRHNSKDVYEEIVPESKLLNFNGPLKFIEEKHGDNGFSIGSANDVFYDLLEREMDFLHENPDNTFIDYSNNIKDFLDSWPVPSYLVNIPLSELTAVKWLDKSGREHTIIGNDPLRIVQDVFDEIRDADKLEIREVSRQKSKKIEERLEQAKEDRRAGIVR